MYITYMQCIYKTILPYIYIYITAENQGKGNPVDKLAKEMGHPLAEGNTAQNMLNLNII